MDKEVLIILILALSTAIIAADQKPADICADQAPCGCHCPDNSVWRLGSMCDSHCDRDRGIPNFLNRPECHKYCGCFCIEDHRFVNYTCQKKHLCPKLPAIPAAPHSGGGSPNHPNGLLPDISVSPVVSVLNAAPSTSPALPLPALPKVPKLL